MLKNFIRFCVVGGLNTGLDILVFNVLLLLRPVHSSMALLAYNSLAYFLGAANSFCWNKWWTFQEKRNVTGKQLRSFGLVTLLGIACNGLFLLLASTLLSKFGLKGFIWSNLAKVLAIGGSFLVSYLGMHFGVFRSDGGVSMPTRNRPRGVFTSKSLSVVLPAYNEEQSISATLRRVLAALDLWHLDFEILVIDDGSRDKTAAVVDWFASRDSRVKLIRHARNRGYGDALKTGFAAATKELTFFMDSDGQFEIEDLAHFFPLIDQYGAVLGYRINRQDTFLRKLNAWVWNRLVSFFFGIHVRDIDCAFKLFRTSFFRTVTLESGGAMINAEILYKLSRAGYTYTEIAVIHLPRTTGKATGAKLHVILRALGQLLYFTEKWRKEEQAQEELQSTSFLQSSR